MSSIPVVADAGAEHALVPHRTIGVARAYAAGRRRWDRAGAHARAGRILRNRALQMNEAVIARRAVGHGITSYAKTDRKVASRVQQAGVVVEIQVRIRAAQGLEVAKLKLSLARWQRGGARQRSIEGE